MDSRQKKTRARLASAVLSLAADRQASEITASEIAITAEINRSTFYQHAASPAALLESVLRTELDELRCTHLGEADLTTARQASEAIRHVTVAVLQHVDSHDAIYIRGLGESSGSASLQPMLSQHFAASIGLLLDRHAVSVPDSTPALPDGFMADAAARFIADGTVGALAVWLSTPRPRSTETFMTAYRTFLPSWWPLPV
ncbi:TetR/AcrR family transcriptional regulator [Agreia pratensis]|uniref:Transcriptional regulator, TetR family n=1 Tax=Agreia pratensis TaxID=150121 RepID=A0A1X7KSR8_9MICO|nr:TetR/AcrR family transcriptional regulator [Agreia pratensis]MBF4635716.1 TetR/AcrR family transcriptional regulator [Agreia pratensis]SMG43910.1 transcriptional regulator, TetR family [Agreia pratensis]